MQLANYVKFFSICKVSGTAFLGQSSEMFKMPSDAGRKLNKEMRGTTVSKPEAFKESIKQAIEEKLGDIKDQIIVELKDDRAFLREEVREARSQRNDIKTIAEKMLTTFQNIALRGLLTAPEADREAAPAPVIKSDTPSEA